MKRKIKPTDLKAVRKALRLKILMSYPVQSYIAKQGVTHRMAGLKKTIGALVLESLTEQGHHMIFPKTHYPIITMMPI